MYIWYAFKLSISQWSAFRNEALKLAGYIDVAHAARELSMYESQLYTWYSKLKNAHSSSKREQEMSVEIARLKRKLAEQVWCTFFNQLDLTSHKDMRLNLNLY